MASSEFKAFVDGLPAVAGEIVQCVKVLSCLVTGVLCQEPTWWKERTNSTLPTVCHTHHMHTQINATSTHMAVLSFTRAQCQTLPGMS